MDTRSEQGSKMLTRSAILGLVGPTRLDDHAIVEIIRTGATQPELVEALTRVSRGSSDVGAEKMRPMSPRVAALCEILSTSSEDFDDFDQS